jgi:hypothetical protein
MTEPGNGPGPEEGNGDEVPPMPFSFKLVVVLGGAYLLYRVVQLLLCIPSLFQGTDCPFL